MIPWLVLITLLAVCAGFIYYALSVVRRGEKQEEDQFRNALYHELLGKHTSKFHMDEFVSRCGVSAKTAKVASESLYRCMCEKVLADGQISEGERRKLDSLRECLAIDSAYATSIENRSKEVRYHEAASRALADGMITQEEALELDRLRGKLGLSKDAAFEAIEQPTKDGYVARFRAMILDRKITPSELEELRTFRHALALSESDARRLIRDDALKMYRQFFHQVIQDGDVSTDEEQKLNWLATEFGLNESDLRVYRDQLNEVKLFAGYRNGNLPRIQTRKLLEGGELCHCDIPCHFVWRTATISKEAAGELALTSIRVIFTSATKSFSYSPAKIVDIQLYGDGLRIQTSTSKGTGAYMVSNPRELEAVLTGLVRKHKFLLSENYSSARSRHIPDDVKRAVWDRDGGRCVRCGSTDYLEFDHIIPHVKGGANTVNNVQLLCRRCNNCKSDRI